jgi:uncharacterized Zn finger protein
MICPSCKSTDVVPRTDSVKRKLLHCRNCGKLWPDTRALDAAAEKALKGIVMGSRVSRVERLAGQLFAATIHSQDDLCSLLVATDDKRHIAFKQSVMMAENFVDWFDWYQKEKSKE